MTKKRTRILSLLLCFTLLFSMLPATAMAYSYGDYFAKFSGRKTFSSDTFSDVSAHSWYYENVKTAYEYGLMEGNSATTFNPNGEISIAETITIAARLHSIYTYGKESFPATNPWYQTYVDYALNNGIISTTYSDYKTAATRAAFATILACALPSDALPEINKVADGGIPDVDLRTDFAPGVYTLYRAGVLTGNDANGTFRPLSSISRGEAAAIVSRMANPSLRKSIQLGTEYLVTFNSNNSYRIITEQLVLKGERVAMPATPLGEPNTVFTGWYTSAFDGKPYDFDTPIYSDMTLYAHWTVTEGDDALPEITTPPTDTTSPTDTIPPTNIAPPKPSADLMDQALDLGGDTSKLTNMPVRTTGQGFFPDYTDMLASPLTSAAYPFEMSDPAVSIGANAFGLTNFVQSAQQSYGANSLAWNASFAVSLDAALEQLFAVAGTTEGLAEAKAAAANINPFLVPALTQYISSLATAQSMNQEAIMELLTSMAPITYSYNTTGSASKIQLVGRATAGDNTTYGPSCMAYAVDDAWNIAIDAPVDGIYYVSLRLHQFTKTGKFQMYIDGVPYGPVFDSWNGNSGKFSKVEHVLGNINLTAGTHTLTIRCIETKGAEGNSDYSRFFLYSITLAPAVDNFVVKYHASTLRDTFATNNPSATQGAYAYSYSSNLTSTTYKALELGDWLSYDFTIDAAGTYDLSCALIRYGAYAQCQMYIDDVPYGDVFEGHLIGYTPSMAPQLATHPLGHVTLSAGKHTLKIVYVGNHANSTGNFICFNSLTICSTDSEQASPVQYYGEYSAAATTFKTLQSFTFCQPATTNTAAVTAYKMQSKVDQAKLRSSGVLVIQATESLAAVAKMLNSYTTTGAALTISTPFGNIVLGTPGDDVYTNPEAMLLMDPAGNDTYNGKVATSLAYNKPIGVLIDAAGNDTYSATNADGATQGSGILGTGVLFDMNGTDTYTASRLAQAYGLIGTGILFDGSGNDSYTINFSGQSAALYGFSTLVDISGDDIYYALAHAQASASNRAMAFLIDKAGNDSYYAEPESANAGVYGSSLKYSDYPNKNGNWSQGCGFGNRSIVTGGISGGIAGLIDLQGDDTYTGGIWVMGVGYWGGIGYLLDVDGSETYTSCYYSQGTTAHNGVGIMIDIGGDDIHTLVHEDDTNYDASGTSLGVVYDRGIGMFINDGGNDIYTGYRQICGVAWTSTDAAATAAQKDHYAFFIDTEGNDYYGNPYSKRGFGYGNGAYFIDGGGTDTYTGTYSVVDGGGYTPDAQPDGGVGIDYTPDVTTKKLPIFLSYELAKDKVLSNLNMHFRLSQ